MAGLFPDIPRVCVCVDQEVKVKNYVQHLSQTLAVNNDLVCIGDLPPEIQHIPLGLSRSGSTQGLEDRISR